MSKIDNKASMQLENINTPVIVNHDRRECTTVAIPAFLIIILTVMPMRSEKQWCTINYGKRKLARTVFDVING